MPEVARSWMQRSFVERQVMKRYLSVFLLGLVSAWATSAQPNLVKVRVRVILVDQDLNQKPVPFFVVSLKCGAKAAEVKTGLEGTAEAQLQPGRCTVSSPKAAELGSRRFSWNIQVALSGPEQNIDLLTNDNAKVEETAAPASSAKAATNDLTEQFKRLKNTVVTVRSESGHGTGFFVDGKGFILTNQHVVGNSEYLAVQFDRTHKVVAKLIAADLQKDVALLSVNIAALPNASPAPLYRAEGSRAPVQEGERVFTIGSPLSLDKIITTGIVSKVEPHTIMSDININPGSSGGPLFNSAGQVIGLTTFGTRGEGGPGVSGIVRIEAALALLDQNRANAKGTPPPGALLPVEPLIPYPIEGLKEALRARKRCGWKNTIHAGIILPLEISIAPFPHLPWITGSRRRGGCRPSASIKSATRKNGVQTKMQMIPMRRRSGKRKPVRIRQYSPYM